MESSDDISQKKVPLTQEEAEIRKLLLTDPQTGFTAVHYNLLLTIRRLKDKHYKEGKDDFEGKVDVIFDYHKRDLVKENIVQHIKESPLFLNFQGTVESVQINNKAVHQFKYANHRLEIDLTKLEENKQNKVSVLFSGNYNHSGVGLHHYIDPVDSKEYLYTQFEPYDCNRLFPCFDQPDLKAVLELTVVAPKEWIVLSNEFEKENSDFTSINNMDNLHILTEKEKDHLFTQTEIYKKDYHYYYFNPTPRISTYLYALCAGPYHCMKSPFDSEVPLRLFFRESLKDFGEPEEMLRVTLAGMKWYKDYFGIAYPFNKYDQIFCPEYNMGAMENVGLVTFNEYYCWKDTPTQRKRTGFAITVLHELAHMWFGNLVTMKWWNDLWLNESFATFISHLCLDRSEELNKTYTTSWLLFGNYKGFAYRADQQTTTHPVMSDVKNTEIAETHFDEIVYEKGSSILKQMYYFIGDQNFSNGLKTYFEIYKWSNTVFDDFINQMVHAIDKSGQFKPTFHLKELCNNWLKKAGLNEVSLDMEVDSNDIITNFSIIQTPCLTQHANLQTHMMDIRFVNDIQNIHSNDNTLFQNVMVNSAEKTVLENMIGKKAPKAVVLNYNDWAYFKWVADRRSIEYLKTDLYKCNDVLTKQLVYRSLFDLTRDAKMSSLEYFDIMSELIKKESNEDILATVLRNVQGIIANYIPLIHYEKYTSIMFDSVAELLTREVTAYNTSHNKTNKELILHLIDFLVGFAYTENHFEALKTWLAADKPSIAGAQFESSFLTQENRFKIVKLIHRSRKTSDEEKEKLLAAEVERDKNSDRSILAKLACYAAKPNKSIKEELWNKFVNQPTSDSLYNMETLMGNFASRDQLDLVGDYLKNKFFDVLHEVGKNNDFFYVRSFVTSLAPSYYVDEETLVKLEKLAEGVKDLDQVHKCVVELIDDMKRCLKAHKKCQEYTKEI